MLKRDWTERIDTFISGFKGWDNFAESLRHLLDKVFLNSPLRPLKNFLNGTWLEHPLHPALTDVPIGAWLTAIVFDLTAVIFHLPNLGIASAVAIGLGILGALGAIATGFLDWQDVNSSELRVGLVHATLNILATILFTISFINRWMINWQIDALNASMAILGFIILSGGAFLGGSLVFRMGAMVNRNSFAAGPKDFVSVLATKDLHENKTVRILFGLLYDRSLPMPVIISIIAQLASIPIFYLARHAANP